MKNSLAELIRNGLSMGDIFIAALTNCKSVKYFYVIFLC